MWGHKRAYWWSNEFKMKYTGERHESVNSMSGLDLEYVIILQVPSVNFGFMFGYK